MYLRARSFTCGAASAKLFFFANSPSPRRLRVSLARQIFFGHLRKITGKGALLAADFLHNKRIFFFQRKGLSKEGKSKCIKQRTLLCVRLELAASIFTEKIVPGLCKATLEKKNERLIHNNTQNNYIFYFYPYIFAPSDRRRRRSEVCAVCSCVWCWSWFLRQFFFQKFRVTRFFSIFWEIKVNFLKVFFLSFLSLFSFFSPSLSLFLILSLFL